MNGQEGGAVPMCMVGVCRECEGWVAVISDRITSDTRREFYQTVAKLDLIPTRMPSEEFRTSAIEVCHRYRKKKAAAVQEALTFPDSPIP